MEGRTMSSAADKRAEAIERISKVRAEIEAKEAEKVAKAEAVKQRKRESRRRWAEQNPEKAKALQAKKNAKKNERINARLAADPAYREERKAKRQQKYQESKDRLAAQRRARLEEVKAMRDKLTQLTTPTEAIMTADIRDVSAEELEARWKFYKALMDAAYRRLREIASEEADYNRRRYLELARTPEGKAEYDAQIASFRAAEVTPRQAFNDASKVCRECSDEMLRRGLL
jgi:hypothetical protein